MTVTGIVLEERYELRSRIGEGTFGRVYRAYDRRLDRFVAVKLLGPWWADEPGWVEIFNRETRMLARCNDPGVVQIFDAGDGPDGPFYVSELVGGEDLATRLRRGRPSPAQAREIAIGICRGLAAAHALSIVHRDVKPGNVLLDDLGRVKVADFGVARLAEAGSAAESRIVGTPRYMAPEQGRGGAVSAAADVYSAGVVLYEMLAGHPPFTEGGPVGLALAHLDQPPPPLGADVPADLRRVVDRALAKSPSDRFADGAEMAAALTPGVPHPGDGHDDAEHDRPAGAWAGTATLAAPARGPRKVFHPASRRREIAIVGVASVVLAGLALVAVVNDRGRLVHRRPSHRAAAVHRVTVPRLVGEDSASAVSRLHALGLRTSITTVPAPGVVPGRVTSETPAAGHTAPRGSQVSLAVAEVPRWRTVTTFAGTESPPVVIRGRQWRIAVSAAATRSCTLLIFCDSTTASVTRVGQGAPFARFGIGDGTVHAFTHSGPGTYRLSVSPASGRTRWTIRVQDDY